jgi:hypothetical protein
LQLSVTVRSSREFALGTVAKLQADTASRLRRPVALELQVIPTIRLTPEVAPSQTATPDVAKASSTP